MSFLQVVVFVSFIPYVVCGNTLRIPIHRSNNQQYIRGNLVNGGGEEPIISEKDYYRGTINVGTPPKQFQVDFDTGSSIPWLTGKNCQVLDISDKCSDQHTFYDEEESKTGNLTGEDFSIVYGQGSVSGYQVEDYISLEDKESSEFGKIELIFGVGNLVDNETDNMTTDGIFGLGFSSFGEPKSPIEQWADTNAFEGDLFTIWLDKNRNNDGEIAFGSLLEDKCGDIIVKTKNKLPYAWWDLVIESIKYDGVEIDTNVVAITDSGTTCITFPSRYQVDDLYSKDKDVVSKHNLTFTIGGHDFEFEGKDLYKGVEVFDNLLPTVILGDTFIRQFCQIHYYKTKEVGFAPNIAP